MSSNLNLEVGDKITVLRTDRTQGQGSREVVGETFIVTEVNPSTWWMMAEHMDGYEIGTCTCTDCAALASAAGEKEREERC